MSCHLEDMFGIYHTQSLMLFCMIIPLHLHTITTNVLLHVDAAVINSNVVSIQLLESVKFVCSVDPSVTTTGIVSYQWTIVCSNDCGWIGVTSATLTNPYIRSRDYGEYACTISEGITVIGRSVFTIDHIGGTFV